MLPMQGQELEVLRAASPFKRIIFCGDGANDLCPSLALLPSDYVLARKVCTTPFSYMFNFCMCSRCRARSLFIALWSSHRALHFASGHTLLLKAFGSCNPP